MQVMVVLNSITHVMHASIGWNTTDIFLNFSHSTQPVFLPLLSMVCQRSICRVWLTVLCSKLLNSKKSRLFTQRVPKFQFTHKMIKWIGLQIIEVIPFCNESGDRTRQIIPSYFPALTNKISTTDICRLPTISKKNLDQINYNP